MNDYQQNSSNNLELLTARAEQGDKEALASVFEAEKSRLARMVDLRMDHRLKGRVDSCDVLQEAFLDAVKQLPNYVERKHEISLFLWLRLVVHQRLMRLHRQHLGAGMRNVAREVSLHKGALPRASSVSLAEQLMGRFTSVSEKLIKAEMRFKLREALSTMDDMDHEIIALRNFEELSNSEVAELLSLSKSAASNRYVRALARLQTVLEIYPGFFDRSP